MSNPAAGFVRALRAGCMADAIRAASLCVLTAATHLVLSPTPSRADCIDYEKTIHVRGGVGSDMGEGFIAVSGSYAYATDWDSGFQIYDITDPDNPRLVRDLNVPTRPRNVAAQGSFAYATGWDNTYFSVLDARVPTDPRMVGQLTMPGACYGVAVSGPYAYVCCASHGLQVVDISDPWHPRIVGSATGTAFGVALDGHYAYVAGWDNGFSVFDVSDPLHPLQIGTLQVPGLTWVVAVSGSFAYVGSIDSYPPAALQVIDVSDPASPQLVASVADLGGIYSIAIAGNRACATLAEYGEMAVVDISNPTAPTILDRLSFPNYYAAGVATLMTPSSGESTVILSGAISYDPMGSSGWVQTIDIGGTARPVPVASLDIPCCPTDLALEGDHAFVTVGGTGLEVIDITDPLHPAIDGSVDTPDYAVAVDVRGTVAYVGDDRAGLQVVSVEDPHAPRILGSVDTPGYTNAVAVSGAYVFVADGEPGLQVIDVSDAADPRIVATVDTPNEAHDVCVSGDYAYVADGSSGLQVIDITDPLRPQIVASIDAPGNTLRVGAWGDHAYFSNGWPEEALHVVDVEDPTHPREIGRMNLMIYAGRITATRHHVYLSNGFLGVQVIDVSDPMRPRNVGYMDTSDYIRGIAVSGPLVYIAETGGGSHPSTFHVFEGQCEPTITHGFPDRAVRSRLMLSAFPNPITTGGSSVRAVMPAAGPARVAIWDVGGRLVRDLYDGILEPGPHDFVWDRKDLRGRPVPAGIYWLRVRAGETNGRERLVVLR